MNLSDLRSTHQKPSFGDFEDRAPFLTLFSFGGFVVGIITGILINPQEVTVLALSIMGTLIAAPWVAALAMPLGRKILWKLSRKPLLSPAEYSRVKNAFNLLERPRKVLNKLNNPAPEYVVAMSDLETATKDAVRKLVNSQGDHYMSEPLGSLFDKLSFNASALYDLLKSEYDAQQAEGLLLAQKTVQGAETLTAFEVSFKAAKERAKEEVVLRQKVRQALLPETH